MSRRPRPNIILICADQHRADALGCEGHPVCRTPHLDRLAATGTRFNRCYATNPVCSPSRATIATGCDSRRHGVRRNGIPLTRDIPTLADLVQAAGYATVAVGKTHHRPHNEGVPTAPFYGFEQLISSEDNKVGPYLDWAMREYPEFEGYFIGTLFNLPANPDYWKGRRNLPREVEACRRKHVQPLEISRTCNWGYGHYSPLPEPAHQTAWLTDRAIDAVSQHDGSRPLMLWVGYQDPHNPFDPPATWRERYDPAQVGDPIPAEDRGAEVPLHIRNYRDFYRDFTPQDWRTLRALYFGGVSFMDDGIGRLLDQVERTLDMRNTIVAYLSDHGEILGDHGIMGKWAYHYDSCMRVPLIARWDGHWDAGRTSEAIVELTDLLPTLRDAAGLKDDAIRDGRSMRPVLTGDTDALRECAYAESYGGAPGDATPAPLNWARTIRTRTWRASFYPGQAHGELYNLDEDPTELNNRWTDPSCRTVIEEHRRLLADRLVLMDYPLSPPPYAV
jgi:arylsulfatase A-like enzyme